MSRAGLWLNLATLAGLTIAAVPDGGRCRHGGHGFRGAAAVSRHHAGPGALRRPHAGNGVVLPAAARRAGLRRRRTPLSGGRPRRRREARHPRGEQGNPLAQVRLAIMYEAGDGVARRQEGGVRVVPARGGRRASRRADGAWWLLRRRRRRAGKLGSRCQALSIERRARLAQGPDRAGTRLRSSASECPRTGSWRSPGSPRLAPRATAKAAITRGGCAISPQQHRLSHAGRARCGDRHPVSASPCCRAMPPA